jgi:alpha-L-fucosidase
MAAGAAKIVDFGNSVAPRPAPRPALAARLAEGPEVYGIVHWGLNTYTDREWGFGDEDPAMLNPDKFDADQIVGACKAGGIGGLIIVAKHHDGFCLWPTMTTEHNITKTPFWECRTENGNCRIKGDYVKEMEQACRRAGIKFGVYVSPWDRNSAAYGTEKYVTDVFQKQIQELLSGGYGEIFEMWFDGANGGDGWYGGAKESRKIPAGYYRYDTETFAMVRSLQPKVCIFSEMDEADFRFGGNERGIVDPDSRSTGGHYDGKWSNYKEWANTGIVGGFKFHPIEADFPLRRGWFYHEKERGTTKCAAYLTKLYLSTVGNAATMNIGIAPDKSGRLDADDVRALAGFGVMRRALFAHEAKMGEPFNVVVMREDVSNGEQVDEWEFVAGGNTVLRGKSIGWKRIRLLETPCDAKDVDLKILKDGGMLKGVSFKLYNADPELVKTVLDAAGDDRETDTAKWMTRNGAASQ